MKIHISTVCEYLSEMLDITNMNLDMAAKYESLNFFSKNEQKFGMDILYLADAREMNEYFSCQQAEQLPKMTIICYGIPEILVEQYPQLSWIFVPESINFFQLANMLQNFFVRLQSWENDLNMAISRSCTLDEIRQIGEEIIKYPIVVWNATFSILSSSDKESFNNDYFKKAITDGYFPDEIITHIVRTQTLAKLADKGVTRICYPGETLSGDPIYLRHCFCSGKRTISICISFAGDLPSEGDAALIEFYFTKFEEYIAKSPKYIQSYHQLYEAFLCELVSGQITDPNEIKSRAKSFAVDFERPYLFYVIGFEEFSNTQVELMSRHLRTAIPNEKYFVYEDKLCLLKDIRSYSCAEDYVEKRFFETLETYHAVCGLSCVFYSLADCSIGYKQAMAALALGRRFHKYEELGAYSSRIFLYKNYMDYHQIEICSREMDPRGFANRKLLMLLADDEQKGKHSARILSTYFKNKMSVTATAQQLYLHRNSVTYNTTRIKEKTGLNLANPADTASAMFTLHVMRYIKERESAKLPV